MSKAHRKMGFFYAKYGLEYYVEITRHLARIEVEFSATILAN
ncbi:hypothetical protein PTUN_a3329 [Pseudoalteromonas tunicata]|nr:hypothetical protein PTUN_a3329 [Pseudoalteromonas tunicata]